MSFCFRFSISDFRRKAGMALVVTLSLIVLVTIAAMAFFARATSNRVIEASRANQILASQLAQTATDYVAGQFLQEIAANSTAYTANGVTIYQPTTNTFAVPQRPLPTDMGTNTNFANLVRRSVSETTNGVGETNASSDNTAATPSKNGRYVGTNVWNAPMLNFGAGFTNTNQLPNWIYVNRDGSVTNAASTNTVGRFAYNVYDVGGLLDANVAGYPSSVTGTNLAAIKGTLAGADLTALSGNLTAAVNNNFVAFRNPIAAGNATDYVNYVQSAASNGFLKTIASTGNSTSANFFTSRQDLIRYAKTQNTPLTNALPYLTTFSRALEQPSFAPDASRPKIVGSAKPPSNAASYEGNNAYFGGEADINMAGTGGFLSVRAGVTPFKRYNGSMSVPGEPLVKTRFPLSRLSWITSDGPSSGASSATKTALLNAGVAQTTIDAGTAANILSCFGLTWNSVTRSWTYNHSVTSGGNPIIGKLSDAATANREPDFAELLKAAINVGSVGKGAYTNQGNNYSYLPDVSGDRQILQIMANLIDQTKTDNYPTTIYPFNTNASTVPVFGTQDLPYFYNWHFFSLMTKKPSPLLSNTDTVPKSVLDSSMTGTANHIKADTLADPGSASYMIIPQIWKPHDANTPQVTGPTNFRVLAETTDPSGTLGYWKIKAAPEMNGESFDGANDITALKPPNSAKSTPAQLDATNGALQFTDSSNGRAFREPTLLWRNNVPNGVTISGTSRTEDASLNGKTYFGILVGDAQISWSATVNGTTYVCQSSTMQRGTSDAGPSGSINDNMTFRMQYQDAGGKWVTYQNTFAEATLQDIPAYPLFVNPADYTSNQYANPMQVFGGGSALTVPRGGPYDPRSSRFATPVRGFFDQDDPTLNGNPTLDAVTMKNNSLTLTGAENQAVADSDFVLMATQRPSTSRGQNYNWTNPSGSYAAQQGFFSSLDFNSGGNFGGMFSQNNPAITLAAGVQNYYEDPDGICRRALGGYVSANGTATGRLTNTGSTVGLPLATASNSFSDHMGTATSQSQSRPIILHRPFRSVGEMSYAFRGTPWKNIDFFTPESGDTALLDVFCVNEPPADAMVAGKVNLNTRQAPVLQAILSGAYRDEWKNLPTPPASGTLSPLTAPEALNVANKLIGITTASDAWRGPLTNIGDLVGHFVPNARPLSESDVYQYKGYTYAGLSGALDASVYTASSTSSTSIQRFRETAIRPLAACGQVRVWNLLIDVVAQAGRYSSGLSSFVVEGEKHYWVHVAIDRFTGQVIDQQLELVAE